MTLVCYSMAGEGRGHAVRAHTVIRELRSAGHRVRVFAPAQAWEFLSNCFRNDNVDNVSVEKIPGLLFGYRGDTVSPVRTAFGAAAYLKALPRLVRYLTEQLRQHNCRLVISDFEPALPRAALATDIPWVSLDHQNFLRVSDLGQLPRRLRTYARLMGQVVRWYTPRPSRQIVSSFYSPPLLPRFHRLGVRQAGVLLRPAVEFAEPAFGDHVLVYMRRNMSKELRTALSNVPFPVRVYGAGVRPADGNMTYCPVSDAEFLEDLRTCRALISHSGNQLIGEALYLDKPVLAFPEKGNYEQEMNAHFLNASGGGLALSVADLTPTLPSEFLSRVAAGEYACGIPRRKLNGNSVVRSALQEILGANSAPTSFTSGVPAA